MCRVLDVKEKKEWCLLFSVTQIQQGTVLVSRDVARVGLSRCLKDAQPGSTVVEENLFCD